MTTITAQVRVWRSWLARKFEIAIASDWLMFNKYGSVGAVEAHNIAVMNNVQTNWDDEFNDELQFVIVTQFVVTTQGGDPWTNSTEAGTLLSSFRSWGNSGGFGVSYDVASLWTDRNFNGGTIGIAYLSAICNSFRYHCLQDFTSNACFERVLVSHELGHNFSASHSSAGTIMAPSVNCTNTWSPQSLNEINTYIPTRTCLSGCASSQPPIANFTASPNEGCAPLIVQYTDQSSGSPGSWNWSFPGGNPSSSTDQNPVVTYVTSGVYDASLTVTNLAGANNQTQNNIVVVESEPFASFDFDQVGLTIIFTNTSTPNATSYAWDFGDGNGK